MPFEKKEIRFLQKLFGWMAPLFDHFEKRFAEIGASNLMTFRHEMTSAFNSELERSFARNDIQQRFLNLLSSPKTKALLLQQMLDIESQLKKEIAADPRYSMLMRLICEADRQLPFSPQKALLMICNSEEMYEDLMVWKSVEVLDVFELQINAPLKSEEHSGFLVRAIERVVNGTYTPYLQYIWILDRVRRNLKLGKCPPAPGKVVNDFLNIPEYSGLVEQNVIEIRNAVAHDTSRFNVRSQKCEVSNRSHKLIAEYDIHELKTLHESAWQMSGQTFQRAVQLYQIRKMMLFFKRIICVPD